LDFFGRYWLNMLIKLVRADGLNKILNSTFDFVILASKLLALNSNPLFLHFDEFVKSVCLSVLRKVNEHSFGEGLEVVLNSVLHDVVDVDDKLLKLSETHMHVVKVTIDVHRGPSQSNHSRAQLVLQIFEVGNKKRFSVGSNLVDDAVILTENELKLVVVVLELFLLKQDNLCRLRNVDSNTGQAFCFTDESEDFRVKVDIQLVVIRMADDQCCLKTSLGLLNLKDPLLAPKVLIGK